ncbi:hypothetical protein HY229_01065 [Candidatus Acetothermia bacterium]|nr:hypothetical protein [Candidatus Acetothermia bacterium]MBI3642681.1 hypothetical protein [Candidatus Acetothermia bacterium]
MQMTIYYTDADQYLIDKIDEKAYRDRKSRSAVILTVLEQFFERDKRLGEILCDMGKLDLKELEKALDAQKKSGGQRIGEVLLEKGVVKEKDVQRALAVQQSR